MKKPVRIALRPDENGALDDVFVNDVSMFRLERMSDDSWWMCCYLAGREDRVNFWINRRGKQVEVCVTEQPPAGEVRYERGSIGA